MVFTARVCTGGEKQKQKPEANMLILHPLTTPTCTSTIIDKYIYPHELMHAHCPNIHGIELPGKKHLNLFPSK